MSAPSKNQRSGPKVKHVIPLCSTCNQQPTWVNYAARGRKNMLLVCACHGFTPIAKSVKN